MSVPAVVLTAMVPLALGLREPRALFGQPVSALSSAAGQ